MAKDKGGLNYKIKVEDQFSKTTALFKAELAASKTAFADFKKTIAGVSKEAQDLAAAQKSIARSVKSSSSGLSDLNKKLDRNQSLEKKINAITRSKATRLDREAVATERLNRAQAARTAALRNTVRLEAQAVGTLNQLVAVSKALGIVARARIRENRAESASIRQKVKLLNAELAAKRALGLVPPSFAQRQAQLTPRTQTPQATGQANTAAKKFNATLATTESTANRIAFTFRRLFGIFAAFTAARVLVGGFRDLVTEGIRFNAQIEQAELGIAALLTALTNVSDATGAAADAGGRLALAQREARRQVALLRKDALTTSATFEQLLETFQIALAPGFTAGLGIEEIRKFTLSISQAANAIGLPQNQLAEEIRSLLSGTIQARTTRIATSLGISNDDIKRAQELGRLFEFLQERFIAFAVAGEQSQKTFSVALTNAKDGIIQIIAEGFTGTNNLPGLFESLRDFIIEIDQSLKSVNLEQSLTLNPKLVEIVRAVAVGLKEAVIQAKILIQNLSFETALRTAQALGATLQAGIKGTSILIEGIITGLQITAGIVNTLKDAFAAIENVLPEGTLRTILVYVIAIKTTTVSLSLLWKGLLITLIPIKAIWKAIRLEILYADVTAKVLKFTFVSLAIGVKALAVALIPVALTLSSFFGGIALGIVAVIGLEQGIKLLVKALTGLDLKLTTITKIGLAGVITGFDLWKNGIRQTWLELQRLITFDESKLRDIRLELQELQFDRAKLEREGSQQISEIIASDDTEGKDILDIIKDVGAKLKEVFSSVESPFGPAIDGAKNFGEALKQIPAIISQSTEAFETQGDVVKELRDEVIKAQDAARLIRLNPDLEQGSPVFDQIKNTLDAENKLRDTTLKLTKQKEDTERKIKGLLADQIAIEQRRKALKSQERSVVTDLLAIARQEAEAKNNVRKQETAVILAKQEFEAETNTAKKEALKTVLGLQIKELGVQKDILKAKQDQATALTSTVDKARFEEVRNVFTDILVNTGLLEASNLTIKDIDESILKLEEKITEEKIAQNEEIARRGAAEARREVFDLQSQLRIQQAANAKIGTQPAERLNEQDLAIAEAELTVLKEKAAFDADNNAKVQQAQRDILQGLFLQKDADTAIDAQKRLILETDKKITLQQQLTNAEIDAANQKLKLTKELAGADTLKQSIIGVREAFRGLVRETEDVFTAIKDIAVNTINATADLLSGLIVDALDPTKDGSVKEKLARFLQQIGQQILAFLVKIAIAKAILGLTSLFGGGEISGATGLAEGGSVPKRGKAGAGHFKRPQGAIRGRQIRPKGLDPRDTVPIWAQPGEWVVRKRSAQMYGSMVMDRINQGLIDPMSLKALASSSGGSMQRSRAVGPGFASGGFVPRSVQRGQQESSPQVSVAAVVPSEKSLERMLAQGKGPFIRFIEENKQSIRRILQ